MGVRHLVSPVLVGRDDLLDLADRRIAEAMTEGGRFLLLAGEAGVGKTRLLGAIERRAAASGFRVVRSGAYPSDLQVPAAILVDLARAMLRQPDLTILGRRLTDRLDDVPAVDDDGGSEGGPHSPAGGLVALALDPARRRRGLVLDVVELLSEVGGPTTPTVVSFDDLHWSDDLTLEILEVLARRVPDTRLLVIGTYRSDELLPRAPMRAWRARLVNQRQAEELRVARLTEKETAVLSGLLMGPGLPPGRDIVQALHARTDGIPLHVEELLAALAGQEGLAARDVRDAGVPETVEDAILARLALRTDAAASVARAGAVIGRSFDLNLLASVTGRSPDELSESLTELADHFILLPAQAPGRFGFRHALICDAIYARISEPDRRRLHARTADAAIARRDVGTDAFLALHFERAGRLDEAYRAARSAADAASAVSSHSEARELYECALRTAAPDLDPVTRAGILEAFGVCAAATDDNAAASEAFSAARAIYRETGQTLAAAAVVGPLVAVRHLLGEGLEVRAAQLRTALAEIEIRPGRGRPSVDPAVERARGRLLAALSEAYMLDRRLDEAIEYGTEARRLAASVDDLATVHHAATTIGACLAFSGRMNEGWATLESAIAGASTDRHEAEGTRAYRMLGTSASVLVEYDRAEHWLRAGIEEAERLELWNHRHYMAAHLAHVAWATGRWSQADELARQALVDGRGGISTRVTALTVIGYVALGRGDLTAAAEMLHAAKSLGLRMHELQRLSPALWGLAEVALAAGDTATALGRAEEGLAASAEVDDGAYLFPFLVTGTRSALARADTVAARRWFQTAGALVRARAIPGTMPSLDHAEGLLELVEGATGQARIHLAAAVVGWSARHRAWEGAWAVADLARVHLRSNQRTEAARRAAEARDLGLGLGAPAVVAAADQILRSVGHGARPEPWAPLTAREFEIARRVAEGYTNVEIAADLGITRKTVASHVEHIMAKLGVGRRAEIAAWTAARPVSHLRPNGADR